MTLPVATTSLETVGALQLSYPAESVHADRVPCPVSKRLLAFAFDTAALSVCIFVAATVCWLLVGAAISFDPMQPDPNNSLRADTARIHVTTYVSTAISLCYFIGSWLILGASPGQRLAGIRLYSAGTGEPLSVTQALSRWVLLGSPLWIVSTATLDALGAALTLASLAWSVVLLVSTLRSDTGQGVHDRWTGSMLTSAAHMPATNNRTLQVVKPHVR